MAACLASILELPIAVVPNFRLDKDPWSSLQEWLGTIGMFAIRFVAKSEHVYPVPSVDCILTGRSPRRDVGHAVVGRMSDRGWTIIHDPHPDGTGLEGEPTWVILLGILQPSRLSWVRRAMYDRS
jgi:hypothetical protein